MELRRESRDGLRHRNGRVPRSPRTAPDGAVCVGMHGLSRGLSRGLRIGILVLVAPLQLGSAIADTWHGLVVAPEIALRLTTRGGTIHTGKPSSVISCKASAGGSAPLPALGSVPWPQRA